METTQIYTPDALGKLLRTVDLKELSKHTDIKYGTLKNYAYGQSNIDKMPIWMAKRIMDVQNQVDFFNRSGNIIVPEKVFKILKNKLGISDRTTYDECVWARILLDNYLSGNLVNDKPYYFFIRLHELAQLDIDLTLFSLSLAQNVRFVFVDDRKNFQDYIFGKEQMSYDQFMNLVSPARFDGQSLYMVIDKNIGRRVSHYKEGGWLRDSVELSHYKYYDVSYMRPFDLRDCKITENTNTFFLEYKLRQFLERGVLGDQLDIVVGVSILRECFKDYTVFDLLPLFVLDELSVRDFLDTRICEKEIYDVLQKDALLDLAVNAWTVFDKDCRKYLNLG